ncbi:MAG TPA: TspO/MBR family protein [Bacteroidales bacterium]|nr:TspO/MBR family protein [Bacteroidales bacterium]
MVKYVNVFLFAVMIIVNYLANALPLNNKTTGQLSDMYPNLFVPAGLTFSIWGVIYILLAGYCIIQFTASNQAANTSTGWLFAATCILNSLWIFAWHYQKLSLSLIIMLALLITLIFINIRISEENTSWLKAAFGVYLGWICIATIANVTALLVNYNWNGFGLSDVTWAIIMIMAGAVIAALSVIRFRNAFIGLSVIWAFTGIIIKRQDDYRQIVITAVTGILIVSVITIISFSRKAI